MKILKKILIGFFFAVFLTFLGAYLSIQLFAKDYIQARLGQSFNQKIHLDSVTYHFPVGFKATNISVEDFLIIKRMYVQFNPGTLFEDNIEISQLELVDPSMVFTQRPAAEAAAETPPVKTEPIENTVSNRRTYTIKKMIINNGLLNYINKGASQPVMIEMTHLKGQLLGLNVPLISQQTQFSLEALTDIKNTPFAKNQISAKGWIDLVKKDLKGTVDVLDQKGQDQMKVKLDAVNNELSVDGVIKLKASQVNDSASLIINQFVQDGKSGQDIQLEAGFSFKRKLDDFRLDTLQVPFNGVVVSADTP